MSNNLRIVKISWIPLLLPLFLECTQVISRIRPIANQMSDKTGKTEDKYLPKVIAARAVGAEKPMVDEIQPEVKPATG
jgi:hypothetical protein